MNSFIRMLRHIVSPLLLFIALIAQLSSASITSMVSIGFAELKEYKAPNNQDAYYTFSSSPVKGDGKRSFSRELLRFKAYRPLLFELIRSHAGVNEEDYSFALRPENLIEISSDSKSGQSFWCSRCGTIVVKTIKKYECKTLCDILDSYASHVFTGPTCIATMLGLYRVQGEGGKPSSSKYYLVAKNVYPPSSSLSQPVQIEKFDLKGSTVGRKASPSSSVMKDLDLMACGKPLDFGDSRSCVLAALERDCLLLSRLGLMDYSLLVAVVQRKQEQRIGEEGKRELAEEAAAAVLDKGQSTSSIEGERQESRLPLAANQKIATAPAASASDGSDSTIGPLEGSMREDRLAAEDFLYPVYCKNEGGRLVVSTGHGTTVYLGIIDLLQRYTLRKLLETLIKSTYSDGDKISAVAPKFYAKRMLGFISNFSS